MEHPWIYWVLASVLLLECVVISLAMALRRRSGRQSARAYVSGWTIAGLGLLGTYFGLCAIRGGDLRGLWANVPILALTGSICLIAGGLSTLKTMRNLPRIPNE